LQTAAGNEAEQAIKETTQETINRRGISWGQVFFVQRNALRRSVWQSPD